LCWGLILFSFGKEFKGQHIIDLMDEELRKKLIEIIRGDEELIHLMKIVRELDLPEVFIAAGAVRNLAWDSLHGYENRTPLNDIDVVYFDSNNIDSERDLEIWKKLCEIEPNVNWEVFNQGRAHLEVGSNNFQKPVSSTEEGIAYWIETPTCVGARLEEDDSVTICAPHGIEDLMSLIVRPVPKPYEDLEIYKKRNSEKKWKKIWPKLRFI